MLGKGVDMRSITRPMESRHGMGLAAFGVATMLGIAVLIAPQAAATEPFPCAGMPGETQTRFETTTGPRCFGVSDGSYLSVGTMTAVTFYAGPSSGQYRFSSTGAEPCGSSSFFMPGERETFPVPRVVCGIRIF